MAEFHLDELRFSEESGHSRSAHTAERVKKLEKVGKLCLGNNFIKRALNSSLTLWVQCALSN